MEYSKAVFQSGSDDENRIATDVLYHCFDTYVHLLSPFMPFLSEELYQRLPDRYSQSVCITDYPETLDYSPFRNEDLDNSMDIAFSLISSLRGMRRYFNVGKARMDVFLVLDDRGQRAVEEHWTAFITLSRSQNVTFVRDARQVPAGCINWKEDEEGAVYVKLKVNGTTNPFALLRCV